VVGDTDAYITVTVNNDEKNTFKTSTVSSKNPEWNEGFVNTTLFLLICVPQSVKMVDLEFRLYDKDDISSDDLLGSLVHPVDVNATALFVGMC
jgi:Ca2+-dependent lipid-binding protein